MVFQKQENEDVRIVLRRHWVCVMDLVFFVIIMSILPIIFYFFLRHYIYLTAGFFNIFVLCLGIYYMFVATLFFIGWLDYYLDSAIITSERVIDIDQESLFNRTVSEVNFSKVQDASGYCKGVLETMMDFGDVLVQSAGTQREFVLEKVPHPHKIAKMIIDLQQSYIDKSRKEMTVDEKAVEIGHDDGL